MRLSFSWTVFLLALVSVLGVQPETSALTVRDADPTDKYQRPTDDPGWSNVNIGGIGQTVLYLGNQWVITAAHVGLQPTLTFDSGTFRRIPGSEVFLTNPTGLTKYNSSGAALATSAEADLVMYRIDTLNQFSGRPEDLDPNILPITIATSQPGTNTQITTIGTGLQKVGSQISLDGSFNVVPFGGQFNGFSTFGGVGARTWGTNRIESDTLLNALYANAENDANNTTVVTAGPRDVSALVVRFDQSSGDDGESQARSGDSGSPVFIKQGNQWQLAGLTHAIFLLAGNSGAAQPGFYSLYGQITAFSDLSDPHYRSQINSLLASTNYSLMGDINLDGVVSGTGSGSWDTDDVTAFISGWGHENRVGGVLTGSILSWKRGDLNQDGVTDLRDFVLIREALGPGTGSASLSSAIGGLLGNVAVPEPATGLSIAIGGAALWALWRRRRAHRRAAV